MDRICDLVLVIGEMGSGKTSLVKHALAHASRKMAFLQNEFAEEMGIEAPFLTDSEGKPFDKLVELPNGCLCCSSTGDTLLAIEALLASYPDIEVLLVQANGLADPVRSVQLFWLDEGKRIPAALATVIAILKGAPKKEFAMAVAISDTVIINFADQYSETALTDLHEYVSSINAACQVLQTSHGRVDLQTILSKASYNHRARLT